MTISSPRRRLSYVLPPPSLPVQRLRLPPPGYPRLGHVGPILIPADGDEAANTTTADASSPHSTELHPRHRLRVASLALDTTTTLEGRDSPEGILYTGGRDGLVISWDLGIRMWRRSKQTLPPITSTSRGRWELMTGWADNEFMDEEDELDSDGDGGDGDILGDVMHYKKQRRRTTAHTDDEEGWRIDDDAFRTGQSTFRQCAEMHGDWVNDVVLCNQNQTVVSASSDGTLKAWNPHSAVPTDPSIFGAHSDYVRCLASCKEQSWIASGSFDRTIKLWDIQSSFSSSFPEPLLTLNPPDTISPKSSVYALATDAYGHLIASGSPERVIRLWDPRSSKRTGKLVGHTDNIRAILISEDAKYLLTGSADASIKLWSLASHRCLHTFTHHTDSVWSLFSTHPSLESFYSGDKTGLVCKVDVEGCTDVSEGECIVLCQDTSISASAHTGVAPGSEGINKILVMDDALLWTASGDSSVRRWKLPPPKYQRAPKLYTDRDMDSMVDSPPSSGHGYNGESMMTTAPSSIRQPRSSTTPSLASLPSPPLLPPPGYAHLAATSSPDDPNQQCQYGIPFPSLVRIISTNDPYSPYSSTKGMRGMMDGDVATLYSAASVMSVPRMAAISGGRPAIPAAFMSADADEQQQQHHNSELAPQPFSGSVSHHSLFPPSATSATYPSQTGYAYPSRPSTQTLSSLPQNLSRSHSIPAPAPSQAYQNYLVRELAEAAVPLLSEPESVISGTQNGLVRSVLLNDRMHALGVDMCGRVEVWDIVRGVCRGVFDLPRGAAASSSSRSSQPEEKTGASMGAMGEGWSPREALEMVRERIEGEAVVQQWCSLDTKTGLLTIHLNDRSWADAEVYADEAGVHNRVDVDETRLNLGKWVLRNLFMGFLKAEASLRLPASSPYNQSLRTKGSHVGLGIAGDSTLTPKTNTTAGAAASMTASSRRGTAPSHIELPGPAGTRTHISRSSITATNGIEPSISTSASGPRPSSVTASSSATITAYVGPKSPPSSFRHSAVISSPFMTPALSPRKSTASLRSSPLITPLIPLAAFNVPDDPLGQSSIPFASDATPTPTQGLMGGIVKRMRSGTLESAAGKHATIQGPPLSSSARDLSAMNGYFALRTRQASESAAVPSSHGATTVLTMNMPPLPPINAVATPGLGGMTPTADDFGGWGSASKDSSAAKESKEGGSLAQQPPTTPGGGLMGRLKVFGRGGAGATISKGKSSTSHSIGTGSGTGAETSTVGTIGTVGSVNEDRDASSNAATADKMSALHELLSQNALIPASSIDAPTNEVPPSISLIITEEPSTPATLNASTPLKNNSSYGGWNTIYRGTVGSTSHDMDTLEDGMPIWLFEYLLFNKAPAVIINKIGFVLLPWVNPRPGFNEETLPELLNVSQSKLTASRFLRIRKVAVHVQEKLEKPLLRSRSHTSLETSVSSPARSSRTPGHSPTTPGHPHTASSSSPSPTSPHGSSSSNLGKFATRAEDAYEILCNEVVLPLDMTLAVVRQFVWKQGAELVMHYRRKKQFEERQITQETGIAL